MRSYDQLCCTHVQNTVARSTLLRPLLDACAKRAMPRRCGHCCAALRAISSTHTRCRCYCIADAGAVRPCGLRARCKPSLDGSIWLFLLCLTGICTIAQSDSSTPVEICTSLGLPYHLSLATPSASSAPVHAPCRAERHFAKLLATVLSRHGPQGTTYASAQRKGMIPRRRNQCPSLLNLLPVLFLPRSFKLDAGESTPSRTGVNDSGSRTYVRPAYYL